MAEPKNAPLAEIVSHPTLIETPAPGAVADLRGDLARIDSLLLARLMSPNGRAEAAQSDRRLSVEEAATKMCVSRDYLYRHADSLPFTVRVGRGLGFSEQGIERWLRRAGH